MGAAIVWTKLVKAMMAMPPPPTRAAAGGGCVRLLSSASNATALFTRMLVRSTTTPCSSASSRCPLSTPRLPAAFSSLRMYSAEPFSSSSSSTSPPPPPPTPPPPHQQQHMATGTARSANNNRGSPLVFSATAHIPGTARVYVLPTTSPHFVFHARLPAEQIPPSAVPDGVHIARSRPYRTLERNAVVLAFFMRRYRYDFWERVVAAPWHAFGARALRDEAAAAGAAAVETAETGASRVKKAAPAASWRGWLYRAGNRLGTRDAADEYFLKTVPLWSQHIEFIYPAGVSTRLIKEQLHSWISARDKHRNLLFIYGISFPFVLYLAKIFFVAANALLCYQLFRIVSHWRALTAINTLSRFLSNPETYVTWTASPELADLIVRRSRQVTDALRRDADEAAAANNGGGGAAGAAAAVPPRRSRVWSIDGKEDHPGSAAAANINMADVHDLHDSVVELLERDLRSAELARNYRRARMQYFVRGEGVGATPAATVAATAAASAGAPVAGAPGGGDAGEGFRGVRRAD
ncbi:hypothetical protein DFJ73DRAFT_26774 [Zopfochytrium polystomum]|nr:hypothetical protein DFJ73DRAFT_26774 [Zopfochytrium polystomum]